MKRFCLFLCGLLVSTMALAGTRLWWQAGEYPGAYLGFGACGGFDFDNDGFNDVLAASSYSTDELQWAGKVSIWSGADQSLLHTIIGETSRSEFGTRGAHAGWVNVGPVEDFVVTAPRFDENHGRIYVYAGGTGALIFSKDGRALGLSNSGFGNAVASSPGDFDGDGRYDVAVAAPGYDTNRGRVYIWSGRRPRRTLLLKDGASSGPFNSPTASNFGSSLTFANVNNDAFSDLIVGEQSYAGRVGRVHVLLGPGGKRAKYSPIVGENGNFGQDVANLGDFDGDGVDDFAVAAPGFSGEFEFQGRVYVYSGISGELIVALHGAGEGDNLGLRISRAGDFNDDGFADVAVQIGDDPYSRVVVMPGPDVGEGYPLIEYNEQNAGFGWNLCSIGDTNGDRVEDLFIATPGRDGTGRFYIESFFP